REAGGSRSREDAERAAVRAVRAADEALVSRMLREPRIAPRCGGRFVERRRLGQSERTEVARPRLRERFAAVFHVEHAIVLDDLERRIERNRSKQPDGDRRACERRDHAARVAAVRDAGRAAEPARNADRGGRHRDRSAVAVLARFYSLAFLARANASARAVL